MKNTCIFTLLSLAVFLVSCNSGGNANSESSPKYLTPGTYTAMMSNYSSTGTQPTECNSEGISPINPVVITESGVECAGGQCSSTPINLNSNPCFSESGETFEVNGIDTYNNCAVSANNIFTTTETISYIESNTTIGTCSFTYTLTPQ